MIEKNIFRNSRLRLALLYTAVMSVFFIVLLIAMHRTIEWAITSEQASDLLNTTRSLARSEIRRSLPPGGRSAVDSEQFAEGEVMSDDERLLRVYANDRLFFYIFNEDNRLLKFSRASYINEEFILGIMREWDTDDQEVRLYTRNMPKLPSLKLMMTSQSITTADGSVHKIFVGKDVTDTYNGIEKATYALMVIGALSLIIAGIIGYFLSGSVMASLRRSYEKQRQFAADASHELRTPLSVVMASAELLKSDPSITSPFLRQVIEDVQDEVKKMTKLVADLLTIARTDDTTSRLKITRIDISAIVMQVVRIMTPVAEKKQIRLTSDVLPKLELQADEQKIRQLILILVDNAIKYTPDGGNVTVRLTAIDRSHIAISVKDTGVGIAPEDHEKIFDRFYRVDKARSRQIGGNGLGLAIARDIVNIHKGTIDIDSAIGQGTTFTVTLRTKLS